MAVSRNLPDIVNDASFLAHRYDEAADAFRLIHVPRETHRNCTFITDEHLPDVESYSLHKRGDLLDQNIKTAPVHFIFHSAYCCSTMLARAFDIDGVSMGLKEPVVLNDMIGWRRRGAEQKKWLDVLDLSLDLLSRPLGDDQAVIVKPSNICNPLAMSALEMRPNARALLLYAPIESFLKSIAKKDMWGRLWVRDLLVGIAKDQYLAGQLSTEELLKLTDLQVAALGWLSQHICFAKIVKRFGPERVKTLNSETFLSHSFDTIASLSSFFDLALSDQQIDGVLNGPAFNSHSKLDQNFQDQGFNAKTRAAEQENINLKFGQEIDMVSKWTLAFAQSLNFQLEIGANLLDR